MSSDFILSPRGAALLRSLSATLAALADHEKTFPAEVSTIIDRLSAHLRSWKGVSHG